MDWLTEVTEPLFLAAGWFRGRSVAVDRGVPAAHPAFAVLQAFGGLRVGASGPGEDCAAADAEFRRLAETPDELAALRPILGPAPICLGLCSQAHEMLWLDDRGRLFRDSLMHSAILLQGRTFAAGMEALLVGRRGRPIAMPGQTEISAWGETIRLGDPRVLTPDDLMSR